MRRTAFALLFLALSCSKSESTFSAATDNAPATQAVRAMSEAASPQGAAESAKEAPLRATSRMIVRDATLSLVVADSARTLQAMTALVEARGGYVTEARQWKDRERMRANATFRVPSNQLTPTLAAMRQGAIRVESETITAQDVSQEFTDLSAQLRTLEATEVELRQLLKTIRERTEKASEVMEIYGELTKVRGDIERISGRMQYLSQLTAMSTIRVDLVPDALAAPVIEPGWQPVATVKNATRSLVNTMKALADVAIWLIVYIVPVALLFVAFAMMVRAVWRRVRAA
jgi:chemotaxis protein histidine kinase CheA